MLILIKTREPNYVPAGVTVRSRIDETMFTGEVSAQQLSDVEGDAAVTSISRASKVRQIG